MSNTQIVPMPESHVRLGVALETPTDSSTYGTFTDPAGTVTGGIYRCIEPKWGDKNERVNYNESFDSRLTEQSHTFRKHKTLNVKHYFYVPRSANEVTALLSYYKALFLPAHLAVATASSDHIFTLDPDFVDTAATPDCLKRHGASIVFQEFKEARAMIGARNNFKLAFATNKGLIIECDWMGMAYGDGLPYDCSAALFTKPAHAGGILDFASATFFICTAAEAATTIPTTTYYPICKQFDFDLGNKPVLLDDCNGANGISGVHIGNILDGQKVTFDVARPLTHGSAIGVTAFPWLKHYLDGELMYWQITLCGVGTYATGAGVRLSGVFQIEDEPDPSAADGMRRIKLAGTSKSATIAAATLEGIKIELFNNIQA
ncbi:hypothetical protein GX586_10270 [bacterium]|nr:hypothetical protein [bacterium]